MTTLNFWNSKLDLLPQKNDIRFGNSNPIKIEDSFDSACVLVKVINSESQRKKDTFHLHRITEEVSHSETCISFQNHITIIQKKRKSLCPSLEATRNLHTVALKPQLPIKATASYFKPHKRVSYFFKARKPFM